MKFFGKVLLTLLLLVLLALVTLYVLLQTRWGASWISRTISDNSAYQLHLSKMEHNFSSPSHLLLDNVSFGRQGQPATLVAKQVDLGLGLIQFSNPFHFSTIRLDQGALNISEQSAPLPLSANRLQLSQMAVNSPQFALPLKAERVDGAVTPWKPRAGNFIGEDARFQFSAGSISLAGVPGQNVLLQGKLAQRQLTLSNVGADVARGGLTGSAQRDAQGNWVISSLHLSSLRLQTADSLQAFLAPILALPSVQVDRLDVTDARLQGPNWAVSDLDFALKNFTLKGGDWQSDDGSLSLNASSFVKGGLLLNDPIINMNFSADGVQLTQFSSRWTNGLVRASGNWARADKKLTLDEFAFAGLEYTLPADWRALWQAPLPAWLDSVAITRFSANRNLIIDINPDFPFQMTSLDGNGENLLLAKNHQWGIWGGKLSFNAGEATFNRVDLRHPSISLSADDQQITVNELSAFAQGGMLEGKATVSQQPQRDLALTLSGRQVPVNELENWGWPALPLQGDGNLNLQLKASLAADAPLKQSADGTLSATVDAQTTRQTMKAGVIQGQ